MARWSKIAHPLRDLKGKTLRTRQEAQRYVLARLRIKPRYKSWRRAAELLLDKDAPADRVAQQIKYAMLLDGILDLEFLRAQQ